MFTNKGQYINLVDKPKMYVDNAEIKIIPQSRVVELSGRDWGWVWNRPGGIVLQKGEDQRQVKIWDLTRILQILFYGLSFLLVTAGVIKALGRNTGEANG